MTCPKCNGKKFIEVDPINPRQAKTPQTLPCECVEEEADYKRSVAYDDYQDNQK